MSRHFIDIVRPGPATIAGAEAHHLLHVLRIAVGQTIFVFDGQGYEAVATVTALGKKTVEVQVNQPYLIERESRLSIVLAFALSKGDKPEWIAQKAVELGVREIIVFSAEHSVVRWKEADRSRKLARLEDVIRGAAAQCGRAFLPPCHFAASTAEAAQLLADCPLRIAFHPEGSASLKNILATPIPINRVALLCGPEGGLSPAEIDLLSGAGWSVCLLGPRILRAETAALAAVAVVQAVTGDLCE